MRIRYEPFSYERALRSPISLSHYPLPCLSARRLKANTANWASVPRHHHHYSGRRIPNTRQTHQSVRSRNSFVTLLSAQPELSVRASTARKVPIPGLWREECALENGRLMSSRVRAQGRTRPTRVRSPLRKHTQGRVRKPFRSLANTESRIQDPQSSAIQGSAVRGERYLDD